jgi:hypothetical protein
VEAAAVIFLRLKCSSLTQSVSEGEEAKKQGIMFGMSFAHSHNVAICSLVVLVERDVVCGREAQGEAPNLAFCDSGSDRWYHRCRDSVVVQAENGLRGRTEGHAGMDMFIHDGTVWQRITSNKGRTAISHRGLRHQGITRDS